jgi:hypothetical protein
LARTCRSGDAEVDDEELEVGDAVEELEVEDVVELEVEDVVDEGLVVVVIFVNRLLNISEKNDDIDGAVAVVVGDVVVVVVGDGVVGDANGDVRGFGDDACLGVSPLRPRLSKKVLPLSLWSR